jgi:hypothetical protein
MVSDTSTADATTAMNNYINAIPSGRLDKYTGADGCSPDVQNVNNTANNAYTTVSGLQGLVKSVAGAQTQSFTSNPPAFSNYPATPNLGDGTTAHQQVTVVNGDLTISGNLTGSGILLVTGTLTFSGDFSYKGLVLVIGAGVLHEQGGGGGGLTGALVVAKIGDNSGCGTTTGHCYSTNPTDGNLLSALGAPTYDYPGGGSAGFHYDSCLIKDITGKSNFTVLARREITY